MAREPVLIQLDIQIGRFPGPTGGSLHFKLTGPNYASTRFLEFPSPSSFALSFFPRFVPPLLRSIFQNRFI